MKQIPFFYSVARFVADPMKNEPRNIGVVIQSPDAHFASCRFVKNLRGKLGRSALAEDFEIVRGYVDDFSAKLGAFSDQNREMFPESSEILREGYLNSLSTDSRSKIQFSPPRGGLSSNPSLELESLFDTFVGEEEIADFIKRSRLKSELRKEFKKRKWLSKAGHKDIAHKGIVADVAIGGSKSGIKHVVDFAMKNGKWLVLETVDLRQKNEKRIENDAFATVFKIDDLHQGLKGKLEGITLVALPAEKDDHFGDIFKALKAYSTNWDHCRYCRDPDVVGTPLNTRWLM